MSIIPPNRGDALVRNGVPTSRFAEFLERVAELGDASVQGTVSGESFTVDKEEIVFVDFPNTTINLPPVTNRRQIIIKHRQNANTTSVVPANQEKIDGEFLKTMTTQYETLTLYGDGSTWNVL